MDIKLYFTEAGTGFPLILLHGNGESCDYFSHQIPYFSRTHHVYALDTRGHGKSPRGTAPFTLDQFAEDLFWFMEEHNITQADLLGFSDGGNIALLFALRHPEHVRKLVLNGANLSPEGVKTSVQFPIELGYRLVSFFARFDQKAVARQELLGLMVLQPHIMPEQLSALSMPVLVIAGTKDMIREDHTRLIAASIPDSRLVLLDGNHFVAASNSDAFNAAAGEFFNG